MDKKQILILVALGAFILLIIVFGVFFRNGKGDPSLNENEQETPFLKEGEQMPIDSVFTPSVPANAELTQPKSISQAAPNSSSNSRFFDMHASSGGFEPDKITVKNGDTVHINLLPNGSNYDFSIPAFELYGLVKDNQPKFAEFSVNRSGTYVFECKNFCPDGKKISGMLIVLP